MGALAVIVTSVWHYWRQNHREIGSNHEEAVPKLMKCECGCARMKKVDCEECDHHAIECMECQNCVWPCDCSEEEVIAEADAALSSKRGKVVSFAEGELSREVKTMSDLSSATMSAGSQDGKPKMVLRSWILNEMRDLTTQELQLEVQKSQEIGEGQRKRSGEVAVPFVEQSPDSRGYFEDLSEISKALKDIVDDHKRSERVA